jgi:2-polyprenyl-6-methoxyphenol hydroxylase-like FAD-dependent oxidoreductase
MTAGPVVIIGAGHAGFQLAMSLRQHGFSERIALLNDEGHLPYQRPPLSKAYLKGAGGPDSLTIRLTPACCADFRRMSFQVSASGCATTMKKTAVTPSSARLQASESENSPSTTSTPIFA